jgi:hypothetical protein
MKYKKIEKEKENQKENRKDDADAYWKKNANSKRGEETNRKIIKVVRT